MFDKEYLKTGQIIDRYTILEEIGRGGMGVVYKAKQKNPDRIVAIKLILDNQSRSRKRFLREAGLTFELEHKNIVATYSAGEFYGNLYMVSEYVEGKTLDTLLEKEEINAEQGLEIITQIASALEYAHSKNIIHRDIKPENIIVDRYGNAKLMDFGLAKNTHKLEEELTKTGEIMGSPKYMAPEQLSGKTRAVSGQADIYALGAILYKIITHTSMISGDSVIEIFFKVKNYKAQSLKKSQIDVPENINFGDLEFVWKKSVAKQHSRYQEVKHLLQDLRDIQAKKRIKTRKIAQLKQWLTIFLILLTTSGVLWYALEKRNIEKNNALEEQITKYYIDGILAFDQENYVKARELFLQIPTRNNKDLLQYYIAATIYEIEKSSSYQRKIEKLQEAITLLEKTHTQFPSNIDLLYTLARCYLEIATSHRNHSEQEKAIPFFENAKTYFQKCTIINGEESNYYSYLAEIYFYQKEYDLCEKSIHKAASLNQWDFRAADLLLKLSVAAPYLQGDNWLLLSNMFFYLKKMPTPLLFQNLAEKVKYKTQYDYLKIITDIKGEKVEVTQHNFYLFLAAEAYLNNKIVAIANTKFVHDIYWQIFHNKEYDIFYRYLAAYSIASLRAYEDCWDTYENSVDIIEKIIICSVLKKNQVPVFEQDTLSHLRAIEISNLDKDQKKLLKMLIAINSYSINVEFPVVLPPSDDQKTVLVDLLKSNELEIKLAAAASAINIYPKGTDINTQALKILEGFLEAENKTWRHYAYYYLLNSHEQSKNNFDYESIYKKGLQDSSEKINLLCLSFLHKFVAIDFPVANNIAELLGIVLDKRMGIKNYDFLKNIQKELEYLAETSPNPELTLQAGCLLAFTLPDFDKLKRLFVHDKFSSVHKCIMIRFFMVADFLLYGFTGSPFRKELIPYSLSEEDVIVQANLYFIGTLFTPITEIQKSFKQVTLETTKVSILNAAGIGMFPVFVPAMKKQNKEFLEPFLSKKSPRLEDNMLREAAYCSIVNLMNKKQQEKLYQNAIIDDNARIKLSASRGFDRFLRIRVRSLQDNIYMLKFSVNGLKLYNAHLLEDIYQKTLDLLLANNLQKEINNTLSKVINLEPQFAKPHYEKALIFLYKKNNLKKAYDEINKAIELLPDYHRYTQMKAEIEYRRENPVQSESLADIVAKQEQIPAILEQAAELYYKLGKYQKMRDVYKKIFANNPYNKKYFLEIAKSYCKENNKKYALLYLSWLKSITKRQYLNTQNKDDLLELKDFSHENFSFIKSELDKMELFK